MKYTFVFGAPVWTEHMVTVEGSDWDECYDNALERVARQHPDEAVRGWTIIQEWPNEETPND